MGRDSKRNKDYFHCRIPRNGTREACLHCRGTATVIAGRGLCEKCWRDKDVRNLYPTRKGRYVFDDSVQTRPVDPDPCPYRPGSLGRVETMERRNRLGYALWHPDDAKSEAEDEIGLPLNLLTFGGAAKMLLSGL